MRILITGGAGFIGAFTAKALVERGDEVVLLDNLDSFVYSAERKQARLEFLFPDEKQRPKLVTASILDQQLLTTIFQDGNFDAVLHFAALTNPGRSLPVPVEYTLVNVLGTVNVLTAAAEHEIERFIFAGSSSVYNDEQTPFQEDMYPLRPKSPYGASKASAETYCSAWHELHGLPVTVLRFFSVYGPWGRPDMAPEIFARQILNDETLAVSQGRARDLTYIDDIVAGVLAGLEKQFDFEIFNIGRGEPQSLDALIAALAQASGKQVRTEPRQAPPGEMNTTYADVSKAKRVLGYSPKVSIEEGAKRLVEWIKEYGT